MSDTTPDPTPEVPAAAGPGDGTAPAAPEPQSAPAAEPAPPAYTAPPAYEAPAAAPAYTQPPAAPAYQQAAPAYSAAPPAYAAAAPKTNTLAIVSLIGGIAGITILWGIGSLVGIICGHMSLGQIKRTGEGGRGMALTGTILGWVSLGLGILGFILFFGVFAAMIANNPDVYNQ